MELKELTPDRIALIKPSALGDVVHSLPVLSALRHRWPNAHITWVINRSYESLIAGHPDLDATLPYDRGAVKRGPITAATSTLAFWRKLRAGRFDLVVDLQGLLRTGLMTWATRAPRRVGFANAREGATRLYTDLVNVPDADEIHAVDRYWRVVEALGAGDRPKRFHVPIRDDATTSVRKMLEDLPRPLIALAVGARWVTKRWPVENFVTAAQYAMSRFGGSVVLVGGKEDAALGESVNRGLNWRTLNAIGETSLPVLAALLNKCDLVIANDTGPLHLAAALGRPVIAPYTCTLVRKHGPYGQFDRTIAASIFCHGSYLRTCDHMGCLPTVSAERMFPLIDEVLAGWARRRSA